MIQVLHRYGKCSICQEAVDCIVPNRMVEDYIEGVTAKERQLIDKVKKLEDQLEKCKNKLKKKGGDIERLKKRNMEMKNVIDGTFERIAHFKKPRIDLTHETDEE